MKNLSSDTPSHDPQADQDLYDVLTKEGEQLDNDEDKSTVGTTPQPDDEDLERPSGDGDAPWGEEPPENIVHFSKQQLGKFKETREKFLEKHFDSKGVADKAQQALVSQQLAHASSGDYETSSPLLSAQAKKLLG